MLKFKAFPLWNHFSTKAVSRYHTPFIVEAVKRLNQKREELAIEADKAWVQFLE